ncbi:MAG: two-component regulator propeller domain-containing protein [Candidatus Marithrix sp.]
MKTLFKILIVTFVVLISPLFAQENNDIRFEHLNVEDGLPSNFTSNVIQDEQGFMWFATKNGLAKYDGSKFTVYKYKKNNQNSLSNNYIWPIIKASNNILWIGTFGGGLNKFDLKTEKFTVYKHADNNPNSLIGNSIQTIFEDNTGILWIGSETDGLSRFNPITEKFVNFYHDKNNSNSLTSNSIYAICQDDTGILWIGTNGGGLNRFDPKTGIFTHYQHKDNNSNSLINDYIWSIYFDKQGILWLGTESGLDSYDIESNKFIHHDGNANNLITSIHEDNKGRLWISTISNGINLFEHDNFINYRNEVNDENSLSNNNVFGVKQDNIGIIWITTDNGINKYDSDNEKFTHYKHSLSNSLSYNSVSSIYKDKNNVVWIATKGGGLDKLENQIFSNYQQENSNINDNAVTVIKPDKNGILWLGTESRGINKFNPETEIFTHYENIPNNSNSLNNNKVWGIDIDKNGILWIALIGGGIDRFDPSTETFIHYNQEQEGKNYFETAWVTAIKIATDGSIWIGTDDSGVSKFNPNTEKFIYYKPDDNISNSLSNNVIHTIFEDSKNIIWVGTNDGLNKFDQLTQTFTAYHTDNGLAGNNIFGILEDNKNYLWISTNKGLSRFNSTTENFKNYNKHDGLQGDIFLPRSAYKSKTGELFFGGTNGFNSFYPDQLTDNPHIPPVVLTNFKIFNKSVSIGGLSPLQQSINFTKHITLSYEQSAFSFEFTALNYRASAKNQYAYLMEGFDKDWTYVGYKRRFATYTNLDAGKYIFRVKASNNDGLWNEVGTSIQLTILPPWWKTWWAYTIYTIFVLGSIIRIFIIQQRKLAYTQAVVKIKELQVETIRLEAVEEKNKLTMASIQYAKVIQSSLLPNVEQVKTYLPNSFIIWLPKDVVGGDMLYVEPVTDGVIVAVTDCTGHGVPGAFMTMIVSTNLKRIIRERTYKSPADILKQLNFLVKTSLRQDTEHAESDDGLDAAICLIQNQTVIFAGAKLPLYYVQQDELIVIKGDKKSLGYKRSDINFNFTNHTVKITNGMCCYLSSDGFYDQLGSQKNNRLGTKRFKELLLKNHKSDFNEQSIELIEAFNGHKGDRERQDDITMLGFGF